jgi:hypothetical protein
MNVNDNLFLVIYDKQKLLNQGAIEIPINVRDFQRLPKQIKDQVKIGKLSKDYYDKNRNNNQILNKYLQQHNQTLENTTATTGIYGMTEEFDVIIPKITFEHGLIHNILFHINETHYNVTENELKYCQNYIKLKNLLYEVTGNHIPFDTER